MSASTCMSRTCTTPQAIQRNFLFLVPTCVYFTYACVDFERYWKRNTVMGKGSSLYWHVLFFRMSECVLHAWFVVLSVHTPESVLTSSTHHLRNYIGRVTKAGSILVQRICLFLTMFCTPLTPALPCAAISWRKAGFRCGATPIPFIWSMAWLRPGGSPPIPGYNEKKYVHQ